MNRKKLISFGIPCFNEELNVARTYTILKKTVSKVQNYQYEYIFVDNGSTDDTKNEIKKLAKKNKDVVGIFLSRNFGPEGSTQATIDFAKGDAMILYDCDLQDPPELVLTLIKKWGKSFELVIGVRKKTQERILMRLARKSFYRIFKKVSNVDIPVDAGHFSLMDRKVIDALKQLPEKYRFYRGLRAWVGFKTTYVFYERNRREFGKSAANTLYYFNYAIRSFFGFSYLPLNITIYTGFLLILFSFIFILIYLLRFLYLGIAIDATTIIILLVVLFGGSQLLAISMIGKYIQVIIEETKNRPLYIVEESTQGNKKN